MGKLADTFVEWSLKQQRWPLLLPLGIPVVFGAAKLFLNIPASEAALHPLTLMGSGVLLALAGGTYGVIGRDAPGIRWVLGGLLVLFGSASIATGAIRLRPVQRPADKLIVALVPFHPVSDSARDDAKNITHRIEQEIIAVGEDGAPVLVLRIQESISGQTVEARKASARDLGRSREINAEIVIWGEMRKESGHDTSVFAYAAVIDPLEPSDPAIGAKAITSEALEESPILGRRSVEEIVLQLPVLLAALAYYKVGELGKAWDLFGSVELGSELQRLADALDPSRTLIRMPESRPTPSPGIKPAAQAEERVVLFGVLHAHSSLSFDVASDPAMLPLRAFEYAHQHGLDFLAITDHHQGLGTANVKNMTAEQYTHDLYQAAMDYNKRHLGSFVAIPGVEWGIISAGNHVNVLGARTLPPSDIEVIEYERLYDWAITNARFLQFNHPPSWRPKKERAQSVGNFGQARYESDEAFVESTDQIAKTVSIITTVAGGYLVGRHSRSDQKTHRDASPRNLAHYMRLLNMGFHISPAGNQDSHSANWGTVTAARTAVVAKERTYEALLQALDQNRVYATEDDELIILFRVRLDGETYWMGDQIPLPSEQVEVALSVRIWQAMGSDGDPIDEGPYTVTVFSDSDGIGGLEAVERKVVEGIPSEEETQIPLEVVRGEYIFLRVTEQNGKDNPIGDGVDEYDNETGLLGSDGRRDDLNDSAWTTPVWFVGVGDVARCVWSTNSSDYHDPDCWAVARISSDNRREGAAPPTGKTKHDCRP